MMTRLAMKEQETPGISEILPGRKEYISSRTFVFFIVLTVVFAAIGVALAAFMFLNPDRFDKSSTIFMGGALFFVYVAIAVFGIRLIGKICGRDFDRIKSAQKEYVKDLGILQELYQDE